MAHIWYSGEWRERSLGCAGGRMGLCSSRLGRLVKSRFGGNQEPRFGHFTSEMPFAHTSRSQGSRWVSKPGAGETWAAGGNLGGNMEIYKKVDPCGERRKRQHLGPREGSTEQTRHCRERRTERGWPGKGDASQRREPSKTGLSCARWIQ